MGTTQTNRTPAHPIHPDNRTHVLSVRTPAHPIHPDNRTHVLSVSGCPGGVSGFWDVRVRSRNDVSQVRDVKRKADAFMALAHRNGDTRTALAALAQSMKAIELEGKFEGRIAPTSINVLVTQEFRTIQVAILSALDDHPLAKMAVLRALEKIEG